MVWRTPHVKKDAVCRRSDGDRTGEGVQEGRNCNSGRFQRLVDRSTNNSSIAKKRVNAFQEDVKKAQAAVVVVTQEKKAKEEVLLREGEVQQEEANGIVAILHKNRLS